MKTYFNLNAPVSNMTPVGDSGNNWGDCWYNVFMIQQIFTGLSRLPDLTLRRADIESYSSVKPYTLRGPRLFTNTGASFVSSSFWLLGASSSVLMSVRTKWNELKETLVVGIITMEKYWINRSYTKSIVTFKETAKSAILFSGFWVFTKCTEKSIKGLQWNHAIFFLFFVMLSKFWYPNV